MRYNTVSLESDLMSKVLGIINFFKISREPYKDIEIEFSRAEKIMKDKNKSVPMTKLSPIFNVISNLVVWNFRNKLKSGIPKKYIDDLESTQGLYFKRDSKVLKSVFNMYEAINQNYKKSSYNTIFDLYIRIFKILTDKNYANAFGIAYTSSKKGNDSMMFVYIEYVALVYALEFMTLSLAEYIVKIDSGYTFDMANKDYCSKYPVFISSVCKNIIKTVVKYEGITNPKNYVLSIIQEEKNKSGTESEIFGEPSQSQEMIPLVVVAAIGFKVTIGIIGLCLAVTVVRYVIYSISCMKIDLTKSLIDQSELVLVNITRLEQNLSKMKKDSPEYNNLIKIIEKQKKHLLELLDIIKKLEHDDISSADNIKDQESDDDDTINSTLDSESPSGSFDV